MTSRDTTPEARGVQLSAWRRLGPAELSAGQARLRLIRRLLGVALFDDAYVEKTAAAP